MSSVRTHVVVSKLRVFSLFVVFLWTLQRAGRQVAGMDGRIVNGTQAQDGEFPYIVSLRRAVSGRHSCGASILNRVWVLTAAHCVSRSKPEELNIQYGSIKLDSNATRVINVSSVHVHEGYQPSQQFIHDIALLRLQKPLEFDGHTRAVRLPEMLQSTPGDSEALLIGWGLNAVSLRRSSTNLHFCAGTIIAPRWTLTAAHCFTYIKSPQEIRVHYGSVELEGSAGRNATVQQIIQHEGYNPTVAIHDIALMLLERDIVFDSVTQAVVLAVPVLQLPMQTEVFVIGWGLNGTTNYLQNHLQKVQLGLLSLTECRKQLHAFLHESQLCASVGAPETPKGHCSGDSGGPLLRRNVQLGIVSWSFKPCGTTPGVYTNVSYYTDWIERKIKEI